MNFIKPKDMPSVTPQLSSGLEKKLEKDFGELDCISRKVVIDELKRYFHDEYYQRTSIQDCRDCFIEDVLNHLPSVTPQPRKGKWMKTPKAVMGEGYMWHCDKCNHEVYQDSSRSYPSEKYCPKCGADMREVEE